MIASLVNQISYRYLKPFLSYRRWNIENRTHTHIRTDTHTSEHQLKISFLDVLDYSEYSDTNISNFFSRKHSFLNEEAKTSFLYMISLFSHTLCPPINKLFLSVTKFSLYIVSFTKVCILTTIKPHCSFTQVIRVDISIFAQSL